MAELTTQDVDTLIGPATPHFAYQIRQRVERLIAGLPEGDPVRSYAEQRLRLLDDPAEVDALDRFHVWTPAYMHERLGWRPRKPLWAVVVRAYARAEPVLVPRDPAFDGCRSWVELAEEPEEDGLLPALTDEAF